MMKLALPILLASVVMIAGIFAFMPVYEASTVHTTIQSTIQNTQLNNMASTFDTDLSSNATATCSAGSFLVYWTFTNGSTFQDSVGSSITNQNTTLGIDRADNPVGLDFQAVLILGNTTVSNGVVAGTAGQTVNFTGKNSGGNLGADSGDLSIAIQCQSTATATLVPTP